MTEIYIVTGAYGHLGNTIIRQLLAKGKQVRGFVRPQDPAVTFEKPVEIIRGDIRRKGSIRPLFASRGATRFYVIHTAGIITIGSGRQEEAVEVNVGGTMNLLDICREHNVERFVYISSVHAIPEAPDGKIIRETDRFSPDTVRGAYAKTKAQATRMVLEHAAHGLPVCVVHPSGILGPYDYGSGHLTQLVMDYLDGRLRAIVKGGYDFVDVRDVAAASIEACTKGTPGACYILSGHFVTLRQLMNELSEISHHRDIRTILPTWLAKTTAPLSEIYYKLLKQPPLYTRYSLETLESNGRFSNEKARRELGFSPRPIRDTLADTVTFLRETGRVKPEKNAAASSRAVQGNTPQEKAARLKQNHHTVQSGRG